MRLEDYTLSIVQNDEWGHWEAGLDEFFALRASGATPEEALEELRRLYVERTAYLEAAGKPLPVPGEPPEPMYATSARIDAQSAMARDFFRRVLGLDYDDVFVSDATRLDEFEDLPVIAERVRDVYGVELGDERERPLWEVLAQIRAAGGPGG